MIIAWEESEKWDTTKGKGKGKGKTWEIMQQEEELKKKDECTVIIAMK